MTKYPLDIDLMFMEWSLLPKGLRMCGFTDASQQKAFCEAKHSQIYDFIGIKEAFIRACEYQAKLNPSNPLVYDEFMAKLERYMTAHLVVLDIYSIMQNIDESPYINQHTKLISENMSNGVRKEGFVMSLLNASAIGQRILAMLPMNSKNIGGVL